VRIVLENQAMQSLGEGDQQPTGPVRFLDER
jgi:hypothetical protein